MGVATIQIGGEATPWEKVYAISISAVDDERPRLVLNNLTELASLEDGGTLSPGQRAWIKLTDTAIDRSPDKDIIIFVHGAKSTAERAAGQAAQLHHSTGQNSVVLLFA